MSVPQAEILGTLQEDGTIVLDQQPALPPGRVRVVVSAETEAANQPTESLYEFLVRTRRELEESGHHFLSEEEVAAYIAEIRQENDRMEAIYQEVEEQYRQREKP